MHIYTYIHICIYIYLELRGVCVADVVVGRASWGGDGAGGIPWHGLRPWYPPRKPKPKMPSRKCHPKPQNLKPESWNPKLETRITEPEISMPGVSVGIDFGPGTHRKPQNGKCHPYDSTPSPET